MAKKVNKSGSKGVKTVVRKYITVEVEDQYGSRTEQEVELGTTLADILPAGVVGYIDNQSASLSTKLEAGMYVRYFQPSAKAGGK